MNKPSVLAAAIAATLLLSACGGGGGGGGNVRPDNPPPAPPPPPPPAPTVCEDENATNPGQPLPCTYRYSGVQDNVLVPIGADEAHSAGFTGEGVKIGMFEDARIAPSAHLDDQVEFYKDYTGQGAEPDGNSRAGHGNVVGSIIAGSPAGDFKGGVAPDAAIYWGRVCYDNSCTFPRIGTAMNEMASAGVRLFNYSLGTVRQTEEENRQAALNLAGYVGAVVTVDGLMVAATGNDGAQDAGSSALLPLYAPQFSDNWLAVSAVSLDAQGQPDGLATYANACGRAAEWCLTAPGLVAFPGVPGTEFTGTGNGTSFATAIVSGAAALVWEAFPWMDGSNVQQTLLTTATDLGAEGVDAVYGWGMVDAAAAVNGPGAFLGQFTADVAAGSYTFSNAIGGDGSLTKLGGGLLRLTGDNGYTGGSDVQGGTLALSGSLASSVTVGNGGTFQSEGGTIRGDYRAVDGATTAIQVGGGMDVTGTADLDGKLSILAAPNDYTVKASETLMTAGNVRGQFDSTEVASGFFWAAELAYTGNAVTANMTRTSAAASAMSFGSEQAVVDGGRQADALFGFTDGLAESGDTAGRGLLFDGAAALMASPDRATAEASLASLTGQVHGTTRTLGIQNALNDGRELAERVGALAQHGHDGAWVQFTGADGDLQRTGYAGAEYQQYGLLVGVDREFDRASAGVALAAGKVDATVDGLGGNLDADRIGVMAYGRAAIGSSGYLSGAVSYDKLDVETHRTVQAGESAAQVYASRDDKALHGRIEAGFSTDANIAPFLAAGVVEHTQGAFSEAGANGLGLTASEDSATVSYAELGARFSHEAGAFTYGGTIAGRRVLSGEDTGFRGWFTGAPEASFIVAGQAVPESAIRAAGNVTYRASNSWLWFAGLGYERASGQSDNVFGTFGVKVGF